MTSAAVYEPSKTLPARIRRRVLPLRARRHVDVDLERPVICFTFDDCPDSVLDNALPQLEARGWSGTVYIATGLLGATNHLGTMMTAEHVCDVARRGHEIGAHTHMHGDLSALGHTLALSDIDQSHAVLSEMGLDDITTFAWPYGQATPKLKSELSARYGSMRGIGRTVHQHSADLNQLGSLPLFTGPDIDRVLSALDAVERLPGLVTLFTHDVRDAPSPYGCTPDELARVIDRVAQMDADVLTISEAVGRIAP